MLGDGAVAAGGTFCPIPTDGDESTLANFMQAAQVSWLFVSLEFLEKALLAARITGITDSRVIVFDPPGLEPYSGARPNFSGLLNTDENLWRSPHEGKDPKKLICVRLFGSGTSGMVKAAEISHAAQLARLDTPLFTRSPVRHNMAPLHAPRLGSWPQYVRKSLCWSTTGGRYSCC